jgi:nitroreductase
MKSAIRLKAFVIHFDTLMSGEIMDVLKAIKGRRSIRAFKSDDVSPEIIEKLIDAATWAPSAGNIQPWEFIIVRESKTRRSLAEAALNQSSIEEASVVIVVCANENRSSEGYGARGRILYCIQDTAAAIENLLLFAYSIGLETCWVGAFEEDEVREILKIPNGVRPVAMIPIGYAAETSLSRKRRPINLIVHRETF